MKHFLANSSQFSNTISKISKNSIPTRARLGNAIASLFFCLALTSCNKDGFYEKAYLDPNAGATTSGTDNGGQVGGGSAGVDGSTQGGVSGGVVGGTDGSATTGSATGGSTTSGSTTGSTSSGATTGSTTSGTTTGTTTAGSTTGSTVGGTTSGSTTSGSTTGSTVGGTTSGSTTSGSTTGSTVGGTTSGSTTSGSTTGSTVGGTTGGSTGVSATETFKQSAEQTKKLDVLWIVDDSGSMADEQASLGRNFDAFISDFITKNVDFKMAITTTDTSSSSKKGKMVAGSDTKLTSAKAQANEAQFMADFKTLVKVGITGSGYEKGLEASEGFMTKYASSWMRSDAYLAVVIISDEEDQSPKTPMEYWNNLTSYKASAGLVKVYTIVDVTKSNTGASGITTGYERYAALSTASSGIVSDIRNDFADVLGDMGSAIINLLDSFALAATPINGSLHVFVNGTETVQFSYDSASRSIKFDQGHIPPVNATIKVTYLK